VLGGETGWEAPSELYRDRRESGIHHETSIFAGGQAGADEDWQMSG
jgi:hypothetical protein